MSYLTTDSTSYERFTKKKGRKDNSHENHDIINSIPTEQKLLYQKKYGDNIEKKSKFITKQSTPIRSGTHDHNKISRSITCPISSSIQDFSNVKRYKNKSINTKNFALPKNFKTESDTIHSKQIIENNWLVQSHKVLMTTATVVQLNYFDKSLVEHQKTAYYSENGIKNLHEFADLIYQEIKHLLDNNNSEHQETRINLLLAIDLKKVKAYRLLKFVKNQQITQQNHHFMEPFEELPPLNYGPEKSDSIQIPDEQTLKLKLPLESDNSMFDIFFRALAVINSLSKNVCKNSSTNVLSLCVGSWHFRNITQGYLLRFLLNNTKVNTLNIMRTIYFVIITTDTPNIYIQMNFELEKGIFMVYNTNRTREFSCDITDWSDEHESILKNSASAKQSQNLYQTECCSSDSCFHVFRSKPASSITSQSSLLVSTISHSDLKSENERRESSILLKGKKSATTCILSIDDLFKHYRICTADIAVSNIFQATSNMFQNKLWMPTIFKMPKTTLNISLFKCNYVNETIFEKISLGCYVDAASYECLKPIMSPSFYTTFFKCLSHTIACTLLSFLISIK